MGAEEEGMSRRRREGGGRAGEGGCGGGLDGRADRDTIGWGGGGGQWGVSGGAVGERVSAAEGDGHDDLVLDAVPLDQEREVVPGPRLRGSGGEGWRGVAMPGERLPGGGAPPVCVNRDRGLSAAESLHERGAREDTHGEDHKRHLLGGIESVFQRMAPGQTPPPPVGVTGFRRCPRRAGLS